MAISETTLKDTVLFISTSRTRRAACSAGSWSVVVDPASNWPMFAKKPVS